MADWREIVKMSPEQKAKIKYNDPRLDSFANEVEKKYNLPDGLIESVKNAGERSNTSQVSGKGAKGVMQFMDKTRASYQHDPSDPLASIDAAGRYFSDLMKQYGGNAMAAVAAYNGGGVQANAVLNGGEPKAKETKDYLTRIRSYMSNRGSTDSQTTAAQQPAHQFDPRIDTDENYAQQLFDYLRSKFQPPAKTDKTSEAVPVVQDEAIG